MSCSVELHCDVLLCVALLYVPLCVVGCVGCVGCVCAVDCVL